MSARSAGDDLKHQSRTLVRESDAKAIHDFGESVSGWQRVWLRLTKRGNQYGAGLSSARYIVPSVLAWE